MFPEPLQSIRLGEVHGLVDHSLFPTFYVLTAKYPFGSSPHALGDYIALYVFIIIHYYNCITDLLFFRLYFGWISFLNLCFF